MIEAALPDGTVLEFPDGTDPLVIQRVVKQRLQPPIPEPVRPDLTEPQSLGTQVGRSLAEGATLGFFPEIVAAGQTGLGKIKLQVR